MVPLALPGCTWKFAIKDKDATYLFEDRNFVIDDFKQNLQAQPHTWIQSRQIRWINIQYGYQGHCPLHWKSVYNFWLPENSCPWVFTRNQFQDTTLFPSQLDTKIGGC